MLQVPPEVDDAWQDYLKETRGLSEERYKAIEPWSWARLCARLGKLKVNRGEHSGT
jgi:hypothetical protein